MKKEVLIALGMSSSEAAVPTLMERLGLMVRLRYAFDLNGPSIYFTVAIVFIAPAVNIPLNWAKLPIGGIL